MRIGYDGKRAVQNFTGLGNYSRYVVQSLSAFAPENEYWLYAPVHRENQQLSSMDGQGKFVTQSVEQLYVVPFQSPAYASHTPQRSHSSPEPMRRIMYRYRSPAFGHHRRELLIFTLFFVGRPLDL